MLARNVRLVPYVAVFNACDSGPCLNGATCVDHNGSFTCTCSSDFTGPRCEVRKYQFSVTSAGGTDLGC